MSGNQLFVNRSALVVVILTFLCGIDLCAMESEKDQPNLLKTYLSGGSMLRVYKQAGLAYEQAGLDYKQAGLDREDSDGLSMKSSSGSSLDGISNSDATEQEAESLQRCADFEQQKELLERELRSNIEVSMEKSRQSQIRIAQITLQAAQRNLVYFRKGAGNTKTMFDDPKITALEMDAIADAEADVQRINQELKNLQSGSLYFSK